MLIRPSKHIGAHRSPTCPVVTAHEHGCCITGHFVKCVALALTPRSQRLGNMARLVAFVGMVHLAGMAFGAVDALAMASPMDLIALEPSFGAAVVVHRINRQHSLAHPFI